MSGTRVAIVTGGNKGIGLAIVRRMCKEFNGDVYLTARDDGRGREAVKLLEGEGLKPKYHQLDITSSASIENLRAYLQDSYGGLDVLINNAGIAYKVASTAPFIEQVTVTMETNFTAMVNICQALLPLLRPHSRVVNVSSFKGSLQKYSNPDVRKRFSDPSLTEAGLVALMDEFVAAVAAGNHRELGWTNAGYGTTKTGVNTLTKIHAREMAASGKEDILINCCCPGWVKTEMGGDKAPLTPDQGAETPVYLALLPSGSPTGEFWSNKKITECVET